MTPKDAILSAILFEEERLVVLVDPQTKTRADTFLIPSPPASAQFVPSLGELWVMGEGDQISAFELPQHS